MSRRSLRRMVTVAVSTAAVSAAIAAPVAASAAEPEPFFSKSSGTTASVSWLEVGALPAAANARGNAHFGELWVDAQTRGAASVFGVVFDVQCRRGVTPYNPAHGGHGGHGEPLTGCRSVGERYIEGGDVTFTLDKTLTTATLTGTLAVGAGHGEPTTAGPPVNITWNGIGSTRTDRVRGSSTDEYGRYTYQYTFTGREATIAEGSAIGPMIFDDEPGEHSYAQIGRYRQADRFRP